MSAFDKRTGRVSAHLLGRASSVFRSKRQKGGKRRTEGELQRGALKKALKGDLNEGDVFGESCSAIIYMILLPKVQKRGRRMTPLQDT